MPLSLVTDFRADLKPRFLEGLGPAELQIVLAAAKRRSFVANSVITNQGDSADYLFLLTKGRGRFFFMTEEGRKILLHWFAAGEIFGASSLLSNPSSYLVSTEMVKDSSVLVWDRVTLASLAARYPELLRNALTTASDYLTLYCAAHVALTCDTAKQRFANVLVNLTRGIGRKVPGGIELDVTNEELANAANVTPFLASRLLSEWHRRGIVIKSRGKVVLRSPERICQAGQSPARPTRHRAQA